VSDAGTGCLPASPIAAIVPSVESGILGRGEELAVLRAFFAQAPASPSAFVLEGEAGIGKSTLWLTGRELARERGLRVLSSRPAEAERSLAFTGLADLFEDVLGQVAPSLSPPRRSALEAALLVSGATDGVDPRALAVAVRDTLEALAAEAPLVIAIDDVQWLDQPSAGALAFAVRRLELPVLVFLACRAAEGIEPSELERALAESVQRLSVSPLSVGAVQALLRERLGRVVARPTLLRIHETSGGNPFYALEIVRALPAGIDPTGPLPVPETLDELVSARLAGLPAHTRDALVLASALGTPSLKLMQAAGIGDDDLEPALAARVVERDDGVVRFTHPLLASVLYQGLSAAERRGVHRTLADVVVDPLERARHLALSTDGTDLEVAAALEDAAALALKRGAVVLAAELGEHALRLTPAAAPDEEHRRMIAAGRAHMAAGEVERARALGDALAARSAEGTPRAEALVFLGDLVSGRLQDRVALQREALREPGITAELRVLINQRLALELRFLEGTAAAEEHARTAHAVAREVDDESLEAGALAALALLGFQSGESDALRTAERACELAEIAGDADLRMRTDFCRAHLLVWSFELADARRRLEAIDRTGGERDERVSAQALWYLALVHLWEGSLDTAVEKAERAREISALYGRDEREAPQSVFPLALALAHRGQLERARELAERGLRLADGVGALLPGFPALIGLIEAWGGDAIGSVSQFERAEQLATTAGWADPGLRWWRPDYVETLLELGRAEETVALIDPWITDAERLGRRWVLAQGVRCRGLAAAASGDVAEALALLERAAAEHAQVGDVFGRARALLALGVVGRRVRQKRAARQAIEDALTGFGTIGAERWRERAESELARFSGRTREEGLTPAERRVAALVAEGRTNREVAATLFLGERTVETHLTHIYAKLGIRSRTELARVFTAHE
jgi:DNA-binding CsgD family transcriptional regulator